MTQHLIDLVEKDSIREEPHQFEIGDTVDVHTKILEGEKERIQVFSGTVIARSGGGSKEMFTVRRIVAGEGVERKFPVNSPRIDKIVVKRRSVIRRAKLYFLRDRVGLGPRPSRALRFRRCAKDADHAIDRPLEIDRGGPRREEHLGGAFDCGVAGAMTAVVAHGERQSVAAPGELNRLLVIERAG